MGALGPSIFWHTVHIHNGSVQQNRVCHEQSFDIPPVLNEVLAKGPLFVLLSAQKRIAFKSFAAPIREYTKRRSGRQRDEVVRRVLVDECEPSKPHHELA